ncbi:MAG: TetR/AcrR family transcriptional regulator, partial [Leifsonia sp.]
FERPIVDPYADWLNTFEDLIRRGEDEGDIAQTVDPGMLAHFIIPAFTGVQLVSDTLTAREDLFQRVREMWTILIPGVVPAERGEELGRLPELITAPD